MLIQFIDTEDAILEFRDAIGFSQTHARYRVTYWAGAGMVRVFAIKKEHVKDVYVNGRKYTGGIV